MRHSYAGERVVKEKGELYLPPTAGQRLDGMGIGQPGYESYRAYKTRAVFPSFVTEAVKAMIGVMHHKPPVIEVPSPLEPLINSATLHGESLALLLRRINEAQLLVGRIGLMLDLAGGATTQSVIPYIATYDAERIINWDDGRREAPTVQVLNLVVLDESETERGADFEWKLVNKYRVLVLGDVSKNEASAVYRQGLFRDTEAVFNTDALIEPSVRGQKLDKIPFVFINSTDLLPDPLDPPLLPLANLCMTIYRGEADYRQSLFMQGQDTLVIKTQAESPNIRIGAGSYIQVPTDGDAKFIGVDSAGLPEQRQALENDRRRAGEIGAQLLDSTSRAKESGEALKVRVAAQTATLNQVALTGAEGLRAILRTAAEWVGADPEKVVVTPNLDFADAGMTPREFLELVQAKEKGLPLSGESLHSLLRENEYTIKDFKDEEALLAVEEGARRQEADRLMQNFDKGFINA